MTANDTEYVLFRGSRLPLPKRRWCGLEFRDDDFYVRSAENEAARLVRDLGCTHSTSVLDIGCGQGRLAIGLLRSLPDCVYFGLDVDASSIAWCQRNLDRNTGHFKFQHLDVYNERYCKTGKKLDWNFRFPVENKSIGICYLYSVFSHTEETDTRIYLHACRKALKPDGRLFFTTFIENNVANVTVNPENYRVKCRGPLHIVRYRKSYLYEMLSDSGFEVTQFNYETESDGQSSIIARLAQSPR